MLARHRDRLVVVRSLKVEQGGAEVFLDEDVGPQSDLYSDTSSKASTRSTRTSKSRSSRSSGSSRKTHRSKRRDRAKQTSLREGGIFEEVRYPTLYSMMLSFPSRGSGDSPIYARMFWGLGVDRWLCWMPSM
jgi:hypothetical protein